ncbi:MAG: hypothetical protein J4F32_06160, partial [Dehalococcoidia bacterium]|nr:hypothetical protein [Dehalococcoidia bacterium]
MLASLRRLERAHPCLRAQAALTPVVVDFIDRWRLALDRGEPLPDVFDLVKLAKPCRIPCLGVSRILRCLERCAKERRIPSPLYLVLAYVHGHALRPGSFKSSCRCGAVLLPIPDIYYPEPDHYDHADPEPAAAPPPPLPPQAPPPAK